MDAAMQAGFPNDQLFPKRGMPINFTVNGGARIARGEAGEAAIVTMNGQPANINTPLEPNSDITIEPSTAGDNAVYTIGQLPEYHESVISFVINGQNVVCPKFVEVNGSLEPDTYVVTGHTPTQHIAGNPKPGYIYRKNNHIAIDCGASLPGGRLAAICLDTGEEFYVSSDMDCKQE